MASPFSLSDEELRRKLLIAQLDETPKQFKRKTRNSSLIFSILIALIVALFTSFKLFFLYILIFIALFYGLYIFNLKKLDVKIYHLQRNLDREVLFAGRYLLLKFNSNVPILQTMYDASSSYGVSANFFKGIVAAVSAGTPLEEALEKARKHTPSERFKRILYPIIVSLKTGSDVTKTLEETLKTIRESLMTEVKGYERKLNTIILLYLVIAVIMPSLGFAIAMILLTFIGIEVNSLLIGLVLLILAVLQYFFVMWIRSVKPVIDL